MSTITLPADVVRVRDEITQLHAMENELKGAWLRAHTAWRAEEAQRFAVTVSVWNAVADDHDGEKRVFNPRIDERLYRIGYEVCDTYRRYLECRAQIQAKSKRLYQMIDTILFPHKPVGSEGA